MAKTICFGELMISFTPEGYRRFLQADRVELCYTGAEANVAASLSLFGDEAAFVTRLPENVIADCGVAHLRKFGIDVSGIVRGGERMGVIYTEKGASQRPSQVVYDRKHTAIAEAKPSDFCWQKCFRDVDWFHFTGITPALGDCLPQIVREACMAAKAQGVKISCDLNYRKKLWSCDRAKQVMETLLPFVDVLIANEEDADKVLGIRADNTDVVGGKLDKSGYVAVAKEIQSCYGIPVIATTLRTSISASDNKWSAMLYRDGHVCYAPEYDVHIVNRVGGGDSFSAGLIHALCKEWDDQLAIRFATAASCLKHSIEQDFNIVSEQEVLNLMYGDGSGRVVR